MSRLFFFFLILKQFDLFSKNNFHISQDVVFFWNIVWEILDQRIIRCPFVLSFVIPESPAHCFSACTHLTKFHNSGPILDLPTSLQSSDPHIAYPLVDLSSSIAPEGGHPWISTWHSPHTPQPLIRMSQCFPHMLVDFFIAHFLPNRIEITRARPSSSLCQAHTRNPLHTF